MKYASLLLLLLNGCAHTASFQKSGEGYGYTVKESDRKDIFDVRANLPAEADGKFRANYLDRAVGEECLARGFLYFDFGLLGANSERGFCYAKPVKFSLGISIDQKIAVQKPSRLVVEDTAMNAHSPVKNNDVIRKLDGKELETIGDFKEMILRLSESGRKSAPLAYERSGILLKTDAAFIELRDATGNPETLESLRGLAP